MLAQLQADTAALEALTAVDDMWNVHLEQLRHEACAAVRALQEKQEDAIAKLRLDQARLSRVVGKGCCWVLLTPHRTQLAGMVHCELGMLPRNRTRKQLEDRWALDCRAALWTGLEVRNGACQMLIP
jgi:hypothetical protein